MSGATASVLCAHCGAKTAKLARDINRAEKRGMKLFCDKKCFGLSRRLNKAKSVKIEEKRLYDIEYRAKNREELKKKKHERFKRDYDPAAAAVKRKARAPYHVEYCRQPEYVAWKQTYDRQYRAKKDYGEFFECALLAQDIRSEALTRMTDYEIRIGKDAVAKSQRRKRQFARSNRAKSEIGPLGDIKRGQRR